jgi:integrase
MPHRQRGHLFREKLKSGQLSHWKIIFRDQTGKNVKITVGPNKHEAQALLRQKLEAIYQGTYAGELKPATFGAYAQSWIAGRANLKPGTRGTYEAILGVYAGAPKGRWQRGQLSHQLVNVFGPRPLASLSVSDVNAWLASAPGKPKTKRNALTLLTQLFADAVEDRVIARNPLKGSRTLQRPRAIHEGDERALMIPSAADVNRILDACPPEASAWLQTLAMTGMRLGESLALRWGDVEPEAQRLHVRHSLAGGRLQVPKSRASRRTIDIGDQLVAGLAAHRRARYGEATPAPDAYVFASAAGGPGDPDNLRHRVWEPTLRAVGLAGIRLHDLRHFYASTLLQQGESVVYVAKQLGHGSASITLKVYAHVLPGERRAANRLEAGLAALRGSAAVAIEPVGGATEVNEEAQ